MKNLASIILLLRLVVHQLTSSYLWKRLQQEAMAQGFNKDTARLLIQQAALGAAEMVVANPELDLSTLREQVTSKGGTTAEALRKRLTNITFLTSCPKRSANHG